MEQFEIKKLKEMVYGAAKAFGQLISELGYEDKASIMETGFIFEMAKFAMYLSSTDGTINWDEADVISAIFDRPLSPSDVVNLVDGTNLYSSEYEKAIPNSLSLAVVIDEKGWDRDEEDESSLSYVIIKYYKVVGAYIVNVDGNIDSNEAQAYNAYINMLERYRDTELNLEPANGITQKRDSVDAPQKR